MNLCYVYGKNIKISGRGLELENWSVIDQDINISKQKPLIGNSYITLSKELNHSKKGLINIQNTDSNKYLKWCLVRYLHLTHKISARNRTIDKYIGSKLDFKDKIRDIHNVEQCREKIVSPLVFLVMKRRKICNLHFKLLLREE